MDTLGFLQELKVSTNTCILVRRMISANSSNYPRSLTHTVAYQGAITLFVVG